MALELDLKNWLKMYRHPDITCRHAITANTHYPGLIPMQDTYRFNDGTTLKLVNLTGTIPVRYKGNVYNIPIVIWLMDTHPYNAPICYVQPTPDMSIKVSMYVDQTGKIYLPYLHDWAPNDSDLLGLIQVMIVTFGEQPPVFAKPRTQEFSAYPPPVPSTGYPQMPMFPPQPFGGSSAYSQTPYPPAATGSSSYPPFQSFPTPFTPYPSGSFNPAVTNNSGTIKDEHIKESLLTAIEEKLMRTMKEQFQQHQAELDTLMRTQQELKQGKNKLDTMLEQLNKEKNDLERNISVLKDKEQELDKAIEKLSNEESIDVDDAVTTTAPLYRQLLTAFGEEAALEDAIYYMGEALRRGVIDLDVFLRQVRTLSRKQFMLRALMQKCRQKAGLAPV